MPDWEHHPSDFDHTSRHGSSRTPFRVSRACKLSLRKGRKGWGSTGSGRSHRRLNGRPWGLVCRRTSAAAATSSCPWLSSTPRSPVHKVQSKSLSRMSASLYVTRDSGTREEGRGRKTAADSLSTGVKHDKFSESQAYSIPGMGYDALSQEHYPLWACVPALVGFFAPPCTPCLSANPRRCVVM